MLVAPPLQREAFLEKIRNRGEQVERQLSFLRPLFTPRTVFMHIGARDCSLALQAAGYVERVYAVDALEDVVKESGRGLRLPCNLRFVNSRDLWSVGESTVDLSFSEHLPGGRLRDIHRSLAPQGRYVFQSNEKPKALRGRLREAGFSGLKVNFLANLLRNPSVLTALK